MGKGIAASKMVQRLWLAVSIGRLCLYLYFFFFFFLFLFLFLFRFRH